MRKVEKVCSKPSACRYDAQRRSGGDMLREVACRFLAWRRPIGCRPNDPTPRISESPYAEWRSRAASEQAVRPSDGLGRFGRPSDGAFAHGTGWDVHEAHCSSIGRFERPYGTVSSWWHHALPCSDEVALAAQRCLNAAQYPLSPPRQIRSLHFDRHVSRRHSAIFPFTLGKSAETGTICTQRSM